MLSALRTHISHRFSQMEHVQAHNPVISKCKLWWNNQKDDMIDWNYTASYIDPHSIQLNSTKTYCTVVFRLSVYRSICLLVSLYPSYLCLSCFCCVSPLHILKCIYLASCQRKKSFFSDCAFIRLIGLSIGLMIWFYIFWWYIQINDCNSCLE